MVDINAKFKGHRILKFIQAWPGLNSSFIVDAAFLNHTDNKAYIFQKHLVYRWDSKCKLPNSRDRRFPKGCVEKDWPKEIKCFYHGKIPNDLDSVYENPKEKKVYFFKGTVSYMWDTVNNTFVGTKPIEDWGNVCNVYKCDFTDKLMKTCHGW